MQLRLIQDPVTPSSERGATAWLSLGFKSEEMQCVLFIGLCDREFTRNHDFTDRLKVQAFIMKV
jgi:hypothetical protein